MKKHIHIILLALISCFFFTAESCHAGNVRIVIIRHAEKPDGGNNLNCQGINRSLQLPKVLYAKYGIPAALFIPAVESGDKTRNARMFQTITPFAVKYNLPINSSHQEEDFSGVANDAKMRNGTVFIIWEHNEIAHIAKALGIKKSAGLEWPDNDYDSIWVITYKNGVATLAKDKEGLTPSANCSF